MSISRRSSFFYLILFLLGVLLLASGCVTEQPSGSMSGITPAATPSLTYYTEQNPPYNYEENGTLRGISIDLLEAITEKMGKNVTRDQVRLVPWNEGYQTALTGNNTMIFVIARIPARENSFKWAGPLPPIVTVVFARSDSGIVINNPEDLQGYHIGAVTDDAAVQQLRDIGINETRLVQEPDASMLVKRALNGEIDLWADSEVSGQYTARQVTGNTSTFQVVYTFSDIPIYYGFSRDVPDATVQAFQKALDTLKSEKDSAGLSTYDRIIQQTRATGLPPAPLTYYTEQNPPFNYMENGTLQGIGVDLLEAITGEMGQKVLRDQVHLVAWPDGYQAALTRNNTVLFTAARLPAREQSFKWAGPVYPYTNVLFARQDRNITIRGPEDLKGYRIGVIPDDIAGTQLKALGIDQSQFVLETNASVLVARLESGEIDLWGYQEAAGWYFIDRVTGNTKTFTNVYTLPSLEGYYVFNNDVPDATVQSFQRALDKVKTVKDPAGSTTYERIVRKYVPSTGT
jgi:polar amino acid transport system substrate-binding protein